MMNEDLVLLELNARWGCDIPFGWIPIIGDQKIPHTEIYNAEYFDDFINDVKLIIKSLYNTDEIYEVLEGGAASVKSLDECVLRYNGMEHLHTNFSFDFVLYFSHEESVTVGGKHLLDEIHKIWPEYKEHFWGIDKV